VERHTQSDAAKISDELWAEQNGDGGGQPRIADTIETQS
jgi:hypothetical protein